MSASAELQRAIFERLRDNAALVAGRVYDRPPASPTYPYISFGATDFTSDETDCAGGGSNTMQIDIWSQAVGRVEAKRITDEVRGILHGAQIAMNGYALVEMQVVLTRVLGDPDGETSHGIVQVTAFIEEPA